MNIVIFFHIFNALFYIIQKIISILFLRVVLERNPSQKVQLIFIIRALSLISTFNKTNVVKLLGYYFLVISLITSFKVVFSKYLCRDALIKLWVKRRNLVIIAELWRNCKILSFSIHVISSVNSNVSSS